jgi:hypothetical protein
MRTSLIEILLYPGARGRLGLKKHLEIFDGGKKDHDSRSEDTGDKHNLDEANQSRNQEVHGRRVPGDR